MKREKENKKKPIYSSFQNTSYIIKNLWKWDKLTAFIEVFRIFAMVVIPFLGILLPKMVIDAITIEANPWELIGLICIVTGALAVSGVLSTVAERIVSFRVAGNGYRYEVLVTKKQITTDYENLMSAEAQNKMDRANSALGDGGAGILAILDGIVKISGNGIGFILYGGIIASLNMWIVALVLASTAISYAMQAYIRNYDFKARAYYSKLDTKLNYIVNRSGDMAVSKDIRLYGMTETFPDIYNHIADERKKWHYKIKSRSFMGNAADAILTLLRDGAGYAVLISMVIAGSLNVAEFVLYFGAIAGFSGWLTGIIESVNIINAISLKINDLRSFLEMPDKSNYNTGCLLPDKKTWPCEIELIDVSYCYPGSENMVLKNINLKIGKGEKLALVGINGAGKTTLVCLICGLLRPTKGMVKLNGRSVDEYNIKKYFELFSCVFQSISFLPTTISENVGMKDDIYNDMSRVEYALELAGISSKISGLSDKIKSKLIKRVHEGAVEFSGGETQKLALARALYKDAPVIILDEPTAALDPIAESEIYMKYAELTSNKTAIYISHRLASTRFCDRIAFLSDGSITEIGSHDELMQLNNDYANMFNIQSHYYKERAGE